MSRTLNVAAITSFDSDVKQAYQDRGANLRDRVRVRNGIVGSSHRFPKLGAGQASRRTPSADVIPMNLNHSNQTVTLEDWNAAEFTDVFDEEKTNIDERKELATAIAAAIRRREDQMILDALDASPTTLLVAASVGGAATDLNTAKLRRANRLLGDKGVGDDDITGVFSHQAKESMLGENQVTSADYNSVRALVNGEVDSFLGVTFRWIATRAEGGLDKTGNDRTSYVFARSAIGHAIGKDQRMEINYIPMKTNWLANMLFSANAVDIDQDGIVEITTTEAA